MAVRFNVMATNIICLSDLHGHLPSNLPKADILLIAGDICPKHDHSPTFQQLWLSGNFNPWMREVQKNIPNIVFIAGNHDFFFEKYDHAASGASWNNRDYPMKGFTGRYYLQDSGITINGLKIWGTPWQRRFYDWAFNLDEPQLAEKWSLIPSDADIIMCHGPAFGYGDAVSAPQKDDTKWPYENVGSPSMLKRIDEIQPKLYVCGHIHSGYGVIYRRHGSQKRNEDTIMVNASYVNERYVPTNKPILITL